MRYDYRCMRHKGNQITACKLGKKSSSTEAKPIVDLGLAFFTAVLPKASAGYGGGGGGGGGGGSGDGERAGVGCAKSRTNNNDDDGAAAATTTTTATTTMLGGDGAAF
jgi:hypothetical protein